MQLATFWGRRRRMLIRERESGCTTGKDIAPSHLLSCPHSLSCGRHGENVRTRGHEEARPPLNCTFAGRKFKYPAALLPQPPPHLSHVAEKEWVPERMVAEVFEAGGAEWVLNVLSYPCSPRTEDRMRRARARRSLAPCAHVWSAICGFAMSMRQITRL